MHGDDDPIERILEGTATHDALAFDEKLRGMGMVPSGTSIYVTQDNLGRLAARLGELDKELRRATGILAPEAAGHVERLVTHVAVEDVREALMEKRLRGRGLPPPVSVDRAGLKVIDAETGSFELIVDAIGLLGAVLTSTPVTAFLVTMQLLDRWARVRTWIRNRKPSAPDEVTGSDLREITRALRTGEFEGVSPDFESELDRKRPSTAMVRSADGSLIVGRTITHISRSNDGSETVIYVEG